MIDVNEIYNEEVRKHRLYKPARLSKPSMKERSTKVRILSTDDEIREAKGLRAKPFKTLTENLLWTLMHKGPLTAREACDLLEKEFDKPFKASSVSAILTSVRSLSELEIEARKHGIAYKLPITPVKEICERIYKNNYKLRKARREDTKMLCSRIEAFSEALKAPQQASKPAEPTSTETISCLTLLQKLLKGFVVEVTVKFKSID